MESSRRGSITTQVLTSSKESKQNQESVDTPEEIITLTRRLIASGGDIRALLSSDQPLSTMQAQSDDTGKGGAGQKIVSKVEEEEEEERTSRKNDLSVLLDCVLPCQMKLPAMVSLPPSPSLIAGILITCRIGQERQPICRYEQPLTPSTMSTTSSATGDRHKVGDSPCYLF